MRLSELTPAIVLLHVFSGMLGCVIGSFLNVVVWRVPRGESLVTPPSHCPNCGHEIRPWENIPVISWLCLRGKCSGCHQPISIRYPLGELATGLVYVIVCYAAWRRNLPVMVLPGYFFVLGTLVCVTQIDIKHRIIPNLICYSGMTVAFLLALLFPSGRLIFGTDYDSTSSGTLILRMVVSLFESSGVDIRSTPLMFAALDCLLGLACGLVLLGIFAIPGFILSTRIWQGRKTLMGMGDMKFLGMLGAFFGADACVYILCAASVAGFIYGVGKKVVRRGHDDSSVVFGPFLSVAAFLWMIFGKVW
ncbi:MAG: prepilin peptidase [Victivallales bacterium]|nr:prepilin peptidase [Victivallales bacterium]